MEPTDIALVTDTAPPSSGVPAGRSATSLADLLWPQVSDEWAGRVGVERLFALGRWLRGLHDSAPDVAAGPPGPTALGDLDDLLAARLAEGDGDPLDRLHWTSLQQWARRLSVTSGTAHGRLGLDTVLAHDGPDHAPGLLVLAPGGLRTAHPALDVGGMYGDLVELTHRARLAGGDPAPYERLLTAFLTGYRGLLGAEPTDLDTYRAAALRVATRAVAGDDPTATGVDLELTRRLVEHCWSLADAS